MNHHVKAMVLLHHYIQCCNSAITWRSITISSIYRTLDWLTGDWTAGVVVSGNGSWYKGCGFEPRRGRVKKIVNSREGRVVQGRVGKWVGYRMTQGQLGRKKDFSILFQVCRHSYAKRRRSKVPSSLAASLNAPEEKCCGPLSCREPA